MDAHANVYAMCADGAPADVCRSASRGQPTLMSVAARAALTGGRAARANTTITSRYGTSAMKMRPPSRVGASADSAESGLRLPSMDWSIGTPMRSVASWPPVGCQNRRNAIATPTLTTAAKTSVRL